jgi:hypothetical protein
MTERRPLKQSKHLSVVNRTKIQEDCVIGINKRTGRANSNFIKHLVKTYDISERTASRQCEIFKKHNNIITVKRVKPLTPRKRRYVSTGKPVGAPKIANKPTVRDRIIYFGKVYSKYYWKLTGWGLSNELLYKGIQMSVATANRFLFRESHAKLLTIKFRREKRRESSFVYVKELLEGTESMLHTSYHPCEWCLEFESTKYVVVWQGIDSPNEHLDSNYKYEEMKNGKMHHSEEFLNTSHLFRFYPYIKNEKIICKCAYCYRLQLSIDKKVERDKEEQEASKRRENETRERRMLKAARNAELRRLFEVYKTNNAPAIAALNAAYEAARQKRKEEREVCNYFVSLKKYRNEVEERAFELEMSTEDVELGSEGENEEGDGLVCLGDESDDYSDCCDDDVRSVDEDGQEGDIDGLINNEDEESVGEDVAYWQVQRKHKLIVYK